MPQQTQKTGFVFQRVRINLTAGLLEIRSALNVIQRGLVVVKRRVALSDVVIKRPEPATLGWVGLGHRDALQVPLNLLRWIGVGDAEHVNGVDGVTCVAVLSREVVSFGKERDCLQGLAGRIEHAPALSR